MEKVKQTINKVTDFSLRDLVSKIKVHNEQPHKEANEFIKVCKGAIVSQYKKVMHVRKKISIVKTS